MFGEVPIGQTSGCQTCGIAIQVKYVKLKRYRVMRHVVIAKRYVKPQIKYKPQNRRTAKPRVRVYCVRLTP